MNASLSDILTPARTAVLVIDLQKAYCSPEGSLAKNGNDISSTQGVIPRIESFLDSARASDVHITFTRMIEDPDFMAANARLKINSTGGLKVASPDSSDLEYEKIRPKPQDSQIIKKTYDALTSELQKILQEKKIKTLVVTGVKTDVCVDTTVRSAFTKGFNVIVPEDLVATTGEKIRNHQSAIDVWKDIFAFVVKSGEITAEWQKQT